MTESNSTETPATPPVVETMPLSAPAKPAPASAGSRGCGGIVLGALLVLVGIPMLICPGPGMAVILAGLGMIGVGLGLKKAGE